MLPSDTSPNASRSAGGNASRYASRSTPDCSMLGNIATIPAANIATIPAANTASSTDSAAVPASRCRNA